jgi:hypothetical protein
MGVFLGQLPPAVLARLKAELAETLIANFCYPRFYDYRSESLRMRPVDRTRRQEVWLYLSSVDFTAWGRVDIMSPELQTYIERLFIHFVQRNRAFFGNQGRKRMADVRMLITSSATTVAEELRAHLTNQNSKRSTFGSPRPVPSWATTHATPLPELTWEQIGQATLLLQQQLEEVRGEAGTHDGRSAAGRQPAALPSVAPQAPVSGRLPLSSEERAPVSPHGRRPGPARSSSTTAAASMPTTPVGRPSGKLSDTSPPHARTLPPEQVVSSTPPLPVQPRPPAAAQAGARSPAAAPPDGALMASNEDITIFEEMRHQLVVWLRIEAVRLGLDISGQSPSQLIELLRRQESYEQTRLQVVSSLLNLIAQVLKNGKASLMDYKQGLMFYLMHTRQLRS